MSNKLDGEIGLDALNRRRRRLYRPPPIQLAFELLLVNRERLVLNVWDWEVRPLPRLPREARLD